jgi:magnesium chelatase subunit I
VSDLSAVVASTAGKIELEAAPDTSEDKVLGKLVQRAVLNVFKRSFSDGELDEVVTAFQGGLTVEASDDMPAREYLRQVGPVHALQAAATRLGASDPATVAAAVEFVLEGLHLSKKLNKDQRPGQNARYRS